MVSTGTAHVGTSIVVDLLWKQQLPISEGGGQLFHHQRSYFPTPFLQKFTLVGGYVSRTRTIHQWGKLGFEATDRGTINETLRSCIISSIWQ
jgi:hypothetical protein